MATLAETLINDAADLGRVNTMYQDSPFVRELPGLIQQVSSSYLNNGVSLNESISKIASEKKYNDEQIQRICEEANNQVYMAKYASFKGNLERDVKFELASVKGVRSVGNGNMEKKASYTPAESPLDRLDNMCFDMTPESDVKIEKIAADKVVRLMDKLAREEEKYANSVTEDVTCVAQTLIEQEKLGNSADEVFRSLCKQANLTDGMMNLYKKAVCENIERMKQANYLPPSFKIELNKYQQDKNFSVGEFGFAKEASATPFISIITENGTSVSEFSDLVKIASRVNSCMVKLAERQNKIKEIDHVFKG